MKNLLYLLVLVTGPLVAQPVISKVYGPNNQNYQPYAMAISPDSGLFIAGGASDRNGGDVLLMRTDANGDTVWTCGFGRTFPDGVTDIHPLSDGRCLVFSTFDNAGQNLAVPKMALSQVSSTGQVLWSKSYTPPAYPSGSGAINPLPDGGYLLTGGVVTASAYHYDGFICKTDSAGNLQWSITNRYTNMLNEGYGPMIICEDGNYLLVGTASGPGSSIILLKMTPTGTILWNKQYSIPSSNIYGGQILPLDSGNFLLFGTAFVGSQAGKAYLMKMDAAGDTIWTATYGGPANSCWGNQVIPSRHGYLICGTEEAFSASPDAWLTEVDSSGQILWSRAYGQGDWEEGFRVCQFASGDIMMGAREQSSPGYYRDWIFRTDSAGIGGLCNEYAVSPERKYLPVTAITPAAFASSFGQQNTETVTSWRGVAIMNNCIITSEKENANAAAISFYPNPAQDELHLEGLMPGETISVYDAFGKKVMSFIAQNVTETIDTRRLPEGVYFLSVMNENGKTLAGKFVVGR